MVEQVSKDDNPLESFFSSSGALDTLTAIAYSTSPEDQDYVAEQINKMLDQPGGYGMLQARIAEYMDPEETLPELTNHVLSNTDIQSVDPARMTDQFQDMVLKLKAMEQNGESGANLAKAVMFYAVGLAHYEWKDRQRGGTPYDEEVDGPIRLATRDESNDLG